MAAPMRRSVLRYFMTYYLRTHSQNEANKQIIIPYIRTFYSTSRNNSPRNTPAVEIEKQNAPVIHQSEKRTKKYSKASEISKAMKMYLEKVQEYNLFVEAETAEYELGRRHLANIMGVDPDLFDQKEIDKAIAYLLPSGLHDKKARPLMKHPLDIIPKQKASAFSLDGRPDHFLFYTKKPLYYDIMHNFAVKLENLIKKETEMKNKGNWNYSLSPLSKFEESAWISKEQLGDLLTEKLSNLDYKKFLVLGTALCKHPLAHLEEEYIMKYRQMFEKQVGVGEMKKELLEDEEGRLFGMGKGRRKTAHATVKVWKDGSGNVSINGHNALYFKEMMYREQIFFPLQFTGKLGEVDVEASVEGGGISCQAGAIRLGISKALCSFLDDEMIKKMNIAGLLTTDPRHSERKKPGQKGARAKFTWVKR